MQDSSSIFEKYCLKITQFFRSRKRHILFFLFAAFCVTFALAPSVVSSLRNVAASNWTEGWKAWKKGDAGTALSCWSKNNFIADVSPRPAKLYYWRIRALEKLGRIEEANLLKCGLAKKFPFDFYTFLLFPEGGAFVCLREEPIKAEALFFPCPWDKEVSMASKRTGMSKKMIWAVMKRESKFRADAISPSGALGLMQLMPATAEAEALSMKVGIFDICLPSHNILLGASYLARLEKKFGSEIPRVLAAYNAGMATVIQWDTLSADDWVEWIEEIPYAETRAFVRSVLENREIYRLIYGENDINSLFVVARERPMSLEKLVSSAKSGK